jgi:hypothetical protein
MCAALRDFHVGGDVLFGLDSPCKEPVVFATARKKFTASCGQPTNSWKTLGATVSISGVGFFDIAHTQKPRALNFAELHPVTGLSSCPAAAHR